jgi:Ca2+-binding EF-hand superfamily protein
MVPSDIGGITRAALAYFFNALSESPSDAEVDQLFWFLDKDNDLYIDWNEYLDCIMSKELPPTDQYQYGEYRQYTVELEHSLLRVFQQELLNQKRLETAKKQLIATGFGEAMLFDHLDYDQKGFLIYEDIEMFIKTKYNNVTAAKIERSWRRLEPDDRERVCYRQFLRCIRPTYFYASYNTHYVSNKSHSPGRAKKSRSSSRNRQDAQSEQVMAGKKKFKGGSTKRSYAILEESYRQAVEREIGQEKDNSIEAQGSPQGRPKSPMKRMKKVPKKFYSKNVNRQKIDKSFEACDADDAQRQAMFHSMTVEDTVDDRAQFNSMRVDPMVFNTNGSSTLMRTSVGKGQTTEDALVERVFEKASSRKVSELRESGVSKKLSDLRESGVEAGIQEDESLGAKDGGN